MQPVQRQRALQLLTAARAQDVDLVRNVEAHCHAHSDSSREYHDRIRHAAFNLRNNPRVGLHVLVESDDVLAEDTLIGRIHQETRARQRRFDDMLQDKYEALNDQTFQAIVRCRRCGSEEVTWDEKQTRSADEGATIYCSCTTCRNRWVMRQ